MALYSSSSRYSRSTGEQIAKRSVPSPSRYTLYTVREGDTLESIAARILGSTERYWELADLNPQVKFPLDLSTGTTLRIPV
jgi:nucleoid-associated protein YgaU